MAAVSGCGRKQDAAGPSAPQEPVNPHFVTITWTASKSNVHGYNVYRLSPSGAPVKLTNGIVLGTEYTDHAVQAGQTYTYFVTSVDYKGLESKPSAKITATVPSAPTSGPPESPHAKP